MAEFVERVIERPSVLKARYQIGSKIAPMNYPTSQSVFHIKDTPPEKAAAKAHIVSSLQSQILSKGKLNWNTATKTGEEMRRTRTNVNSTVSVPEHSYFILLNL